MSTETKTKKPDPYEQENAEAERLAEELEAPMGAENLGKEAFKTAQEEKLKLSVFTN